MSFGQSKQGLSEYSSVGVQSGIEEASPHRLIQMLLDGALARIASARGFMARGEAAKKGEHLGRAISIIEGLRVSLDRQQGGALATNLDNLYEYMGRRLVEANLNNEVAILTEVHGLLQEIKSGWDALPVEVRGETAEAQKASA